MNICIGSEGQIFEQLSPADSHSIAYQAAPSGVIHGLAQNERAGVNLAMVRATQVHALGFSVAGRLSTLLGGRGGSEIGLRLPTDRSVANCRLQAFLGERMRHVIQGVECGDLTFAALLAITFHYMPDTIDGASCEMASAIRSPQSRNPTSPRGCQSGQPILHKVNSFGTTKSKVSRDIWCAKDCASVYRSR